MIENIGLPVIWIALIIIFLLVEMVTVGLTTIWLAGGALVAFLLSIVHAPLAIQIVAFLVVSFVLIYFTRPWATKYINSRRTKTNADSLIGQVVKVTKEINNSELKGKVLANGIDWSARSADDQKKIEAGKMVKVLRIEGVKLIVEPMEDGNK